MGHMRIQPTDVYFPYGKEGMTFERGFQRLPWTWTLDGGEGTTPVAISDQYGANSSSVSFSKEVQQRQRRGNE